MKKIPFLLALLALAVGGRADDNAAKLALAREAISAMKADKMFDSLAAQMKQVTNRFAMPPTTATPEERQKFEQLQAKIMDLSMEQAKGIITKMDAIYASVYSEAELKAMVAFFKSPEGESMLAKQPQIMAQVMPLVQQMQQELMPKVKQLVDEARAQAKPPAAPATPAAPTFTIPDGAAPK